MLHIVGVNDWVLADKATGKSEYGESMSEPSNMLMNYTKIFGILEKDDF